MVIGAAVDMFGGGANQRAKSAADKLIQGVRQATDAELAGIDAARAAALGGATGGGLRSRQGIANALAFLTGEQVAPMTAADFGISPGAVGSEFGQATTTPFKVFGEDGEATLLSPSALALTQSGLMAGMGPEADPNTPQGPGVVSRTIQPQQAIETGGVSPVPFAGAGGGLLGTVREPFQPFVEAGQQGAASLRNPMNIYFNDPGFRFRLEEGQKALERSAAARGGLVSGQTLKDVQQFGQRLASEEYGNAYNRALAAAGLGLGATSTQAGLTSDVGTRIVQGLLGLGQQESDIAREVADIASYSTLGAGQAIANRERLLGEIKAGKKASQLTTGEQLDEILGPVLGVAGGLIGAYFGGPMGAMAGSQAGSTLGGAGRSEFQGRNMTAAEQLIANFGTGGE